MQTTQHDMKIARHTARHIPRYPAPVDRHGPGWSPASMYMPQRLRNLVKFIADPTRLAHAAGLDEDTLDRLIDGRPRGSSMATPTYQAGDSNRRPWNTTPQRVYTAWKNAPTQDPGEPTIAVMERLAGLLGVDPAVLAWNIPLHCTAPSTEGHSQFGSCDLCVREFYAGERRSASFHHRLQQAIDAYALPGERVILPDKCGPVGWVLDGSHVPTIEQIERLACALDCAPVWLSWGWGPSGYSSGGAAP